MKGKRKMIKEHAIALKRERLNKIINGGKATQGVIRKLKRELRNADK